MLLRTPHTSSMHMAKMDFKLSKYLNIVGHYDEYLLRTKQDDLIVVIQLSGLLGEIKSAAELYQYKTLWSDLYTSVSSGEFAIYFHVLQKNDAYRLNSSCQEGFAQTLDLAYQAQRAKTNKFKQEYYLSIIHKRSQLAHNFFERLSFSKVEKKAMANLAEAKKSLMDVASRFMHALSEYRPKRLTCYETTEGLRSEPLEFIYYLINLVSRPVYLSPQDYSKVLPQTRIYAEQHVLSWQHTEKECYAGILGVKAYCAQTRFATLNKLLALPGRFVLTEVYLPRPKQEVLTTISKQRTRLVNAHDPAQTQINHIAFAHDQLAGGEVAYGDHALSLMCLGETKVAVDKLIAKADAHLIDLGIHAIREDLNLELTFLGSIPGNQHYLVRKSLLSTLNVADLCTFNNHYRGEALGSIWGEPVSLFSSSSGNNIFFNFHVDKVGSTAIYGQTGSGKTLLTDFLLAQSTKFIKQDLHIFFFDYLRGSEPFIRALGGEYIRIGQEKRVFNPLQMPDTPENRKDLEIWLNLLLSEHGEKLSTRDAAYIHEAVDTIFANPQSDRTLAELAPSLKTNHLKERLKLWYHDGSRADYFGGECDQLTLGKAIIGMDMTHVLKDDLALAPTLYYLLMRIRHAMQQTSHAPFIIVLEEGWSLLRCALFRDILEEWILTIRRLNGIIIFLTQNPEQLSKYHELSAIINSNVQTKIFFPNYQATPDVYCKLLGLSAHELHLIKSTPKSSHYFLLKQAEFSCLATVPLAGLEDYICVLSGDMKKAILLDELRRELGNDVNTWLPVYIEKCRGK